MAIFEGVEKVQVLHEAPVQRAGVREIRMRGDNEAVGPAQAGKRRKV